MQTWNQCPVPTSTMSTPMAPAPTGYTAPSTNPMAYMQYCNQPVPTGYTAEQWAAAQQQNWAHYQQWQQQYQQWQAQYGEKYQESIMKQYGQQAPPLPLTSQQPPLPPKDEKPPLPPTSTVSSYGYYEAPAPLPSGSSGGVKRPAGSELESDSAKKMKESDEELSEAEKIFDAEFKRAEEQFNTWKLQNANHPDKDKYNQYVAQYTSWREKQIKRREQKRLKREQQKLAAAAKADPEKKDTSSGIGKSLGLTSTEQMASTTTTAQVGPAVPMQQPTAMVTPQVSMTPMMQPADMTQAWAQWGQYTQPMATPMTQYGMPTPISMTAPAQPNFSQPPPGFSPANFSQPPPGFSQPPPSVNANSLPPPVSKPPVNTGLQPQQGPNYSQSNFNQPQNQQKGPPCTDNNQIQNRFNAAPPVNFNNQGGNFNNTGNRNNNFNPGNMTGNRGNVSGNQANMHGNQANMGRNQENMDGNQGNMGGNQGNKNNYNRGNNNQNRFDGSNKGGNFGNDNNENNNRFGNRPQTKNQEFNENGVDFNSRGPHDFDNDGPNSGNRPPNNLNNGPNLKNRDLNNFDKDGPNFGNRGPNSFNNDSPNFGNKGPNNFRKDAPNFENRGSNNFNQDGPNFGNRGPNNFGNREANNFNNDGPNFGNRGPNNFGNRESNNFNNDGPNFGNRGPNNFGNRESDNFNNDGPNFGNRGPNNFGNRESNNFNNDGPNNFGNRGPNNFSNRGPNNFCNDGPNDFGNRGPNNFGNDGPNNFGNREPNNFGNRGPKNFDKNSGANFENRNDFDNVGPTFKNRNPNDFGSNEPNFGYQDCFGIQDPSNLPNDVSNNVENKGPNAFENNSPLEFNKGPNKKNKKGKNKMNKDSKTEEFVENLNPISDKVRQGLDKPENKKFSYGNPDSQKTRSRIPAEDGQTLNTNPEPPELKYPPEQQPRVPSFSDDITFGDKNDFIRPSTKQCPMKFDEPSMNQNCFPSFNSENFNNVPPLFGPREAINQPPLGPPSTQKSIPSLLDLKIVPPPKNKIPPRLQLNNNSGDAPKNKKEFTAPAKVIDYAHSKKSIVTEFVEPIFVFDYGHGKLHPNVPNLSADFKNWEENEDNLSVYYEEIKRKGEKMGIIWRSNPPGLANTLLREETRSLTTDKEEKSDISETEKDRVDRCRDKDERREMNTDERLSDESCETDRDKDRNEERDEDRDEPCNNLIQSEKERDNDRYSERSRDRDEDYRHRNKDQEDQYDGRSDKDPKDKNLDIDRNEKNEKDKLIRMKQDKSTDKNDKEISAGEKSSSPDTNEGAEEKNKSKKLAKSEDSLPEIKKNVLVITPKIKELPKTPNLTIVDDLLCSPSRLTRSPKIAIILRGPPGSGKSFVANLIKDKEVAQGGPAPRILSINDYFLVKKDSDPADDKTDEMEYNYEEAMEPEYSRHLVKTFRKDVNDGFFNFIILDNINEKISDYEEMWSFAKTKDFEVYVCEMEIDVQICLKRNIHNRSEDEINRIVDYFEPTPSHHHKLDVTSLLQEQAIKDVEMGDVQQASNDDFNDNSQDSQENTEKMGSLKWEKMETEDKLDRLDGLRRKHKNKPQTMEDFLQVPDSYFAEDDTGKKHVRWADLEERRQQDNMRAVGFDVGHTNWNRTTDPTYGGSAPTHKKYISPRFKSNFKKRRFNKR